MISRLTPDTGLPALAVSVLFFVTLLQRRLRRWIERTVCVWGVTPLAAFVVKFIVLALAGPADRPLARAPRPWSTA